MDEQIKKLYTHTHTHTHNGILFNHKNKKIIQFVTTLMDPEDIKLGEMSDRKRKMLHDFTYMWNLIKKQKTHGKIYLVGDYHSTEKSIVGRGT